MKGKMLWIRVGFVAVLAALIAAGELITLAPALVWGAGFPLFMVIRNWRALKYSKKRPFNAEQLASNFEKGMQDKTKGDG